MKKIISKPATKANKSSAQLNKLSAKLNQLGTEMDQSSAQMEEFFARIVSSMCTEDVELYPFPEKTTSGEVNTEQEN